MSMGVDVVGEAVPSWIAAVATVGALIAAVYAGVWAKRAATWTESQARSAARQVAVQKQELAHAQAEAVSARQDAERERAERTQSMEIEQAERARDARQREERRLDALAPSVFMDARPAVGDVSHGFPLEIRGDNDRWGILGAPREFKRGDHAVFRESLNIIVENVSAVPARIDMIDPDGGVLDELPEGHAGPLWVMPGGRLVMTWRRKFVLADVLDQEGIQRPEVLVFRVKLMVRDVGMNVGDVYAFSGAVAYAEVDGSRIIMQGVPPEGWTDRVAVPIAPRRYERLEVADATSAAGSSN
ncbi:hypothetical protein [Agromyces sp. CCNWLW203]|uniref:hypothetical protein n=1 Tax=Agromyces sp. CCNWLW203 TaxID=3112842 RepID=UPI002F964440